VISVNADKVRTDEMSFVAILVINGYMPTMTKEGGSVVWEIPDDECDEFCEELVDEFVRGACRVEPRRYIREYVQVRKDLYKFLGVPDGRGLRSSAAG
jgi:hypothetical protein